MSGSISPCQRATPEMRANQKAQSKFAYAITSLWLCLALAGCGGGSSANDQLSSTPPAPSITAFAPKQLALSWSAIQAATSYQLQRWESGMWINDGPVLAAATTRAISTVAVHQTDWEQLSYRVLACTSGGCTPSAPSAASSLMPASIGYFKASNTQSLAMFGTSVAMSGDGTTLAVGAPYEMSSNTGINGHAYFGPSSTGAVYVFTKSPSGWSQQAYIKPAVAGGDENFGKSISLSADGNTLAVGAPHESSAATGIDGDQTNSSAVYSGAAFVFKRSLGAWSQSAYVKASNTEAHDYFGSAVALSGDGNMLAVGAPYEASNATGIGGDQTDNSATGAGAVYTFELVGTTWSQRDYIKPSNTSIYGLLFGRDLKFSADGNTLAVAAPFESSNALMINGDQTDHSNPGRGAIYVFLKTPSAWTQSAYIKATSAGSLGSTMALSADGSVLAAGAGDSSASAGIDGNAFDTSLPGSGAVFVFRKSAGAWSQQTYIKSSNPDAFDVFGKALALSADGNTLVVGAYCESSRSVGIGGDPTDNSASSSGAAYMFVSANGTWTQKKYIKPSNTRASVLFGVAVALSADATTLAVGAWGEQSSATGVGGDQTNTSAHTSGAVYLY